MRADTAPSESEKFWWHSCNFDVSDLNAFIWTSVVVYDLIYHREALRCVTLWKSYLWALGYWLFPVVVCCETLFVVVCFFLRWRVCRYERIQFEWFYVPSGFGYVLFVSVIGTVLSVSPSGFWLELFSEFLIITVSCFVTVLYTKFMFILTVEHRFTGIVYVLFLVP